jgi:glycerol transport system substrate-binding protein
MRTFKLLDGATRLKDLGEDFGAGLSQREVDYLVAEEWARNANEIVWRRTKLGLKLSAEQRWKLDLYLTSQGGRRSMTMDRRHVPVRPAVSDPKGWFSIDIRFGSFNIQRPILYVPLRNGPPNPSITLARKSMLKNVLTSVAVLATVSFAGFAFAGIEEAKKWVDKEFQPSTLSKEEQMKEMEWFIKAAKPFKGMEINVLSETVPTHTYESETLTKAFEQITGIKVNHQLLGEGEVVQAVQTQMQTNRNLYDAYINDSDLIGTHSRLQSAVNLTDWMAGEGKDVTLPTLDIDDFIGKSFTTGPDGKLWQLPDQQFANLYWFRKDWFDRQDLKDKFKAKYGYDLGVPVNWSAYEDIADFFTNDVKEIDGVRIYGHMDYGKRAPDLGWRMTDAWLSMAGSTSKGLPNGRPIDEWGIRMDEGSCNPAGASVSRGGGTNSPASIYAIAKWDEWLRKYAPPGAADLDFYQSLPALNQGNVAQQIFWYTAFTADMVKPKSQGNNTVNDAGVPLWRMAPSPHGPYWEDGMKLGYQDCGSWTMFKSTPLDRRKAPLALCPVYGIENRVAEEEPCGADYHPRFGHPG